jgi:hypothetical protein
VRATSALAAFALLSGSVARAAGDKLIFAVAPGSKVLKRVNISHELRIDNMGKVLDDSPFVSDNTGGWITSTITISYLDEFRRTTENRPLEFVRTIREARNEVKATVTRSSGETQPESSGSRSPLRKQSVAFQWIEEERDWSRCYEKIEADEPWLAALRGEFELLALLPAGEVEPGATWTIDPVATRTVFAPGGNLQMTPTGGSLFGRLVEVGVGGDFADFYQPAGGSVEAVYRGRRDVPEGDGGATLSVGVVELTFNIVSHADRADLYFRAMPAEERREFARLEEVPVDYTFTGKGELLWDLARSRAHSLVVEGQEGFVSSVTKTRLDQREEHRVSQQGYFSGPLKFEVRFSDGAALDAEPDVDSPKKSKRR